MSGNTVNEAGNEGGSVTVGLPEPLLIEMGIGWTRNPADRTRLTSAHIFDYVAEIERLRAAAPQWQPIDTAPVEPYHPDKSTTYRPRFLVQLEQRAGNPPWVCEASAYWVPPRRGSTSAPILRWANSMGQCFPKYWMPLPAPRVEL